MCVCRLTAEACLLLTGLSIAPGLPLLEQTHIFEATREETSASTLPSPNDYYFQDSASGPGLVRRM